MERHSVDGGRRAGRLRRRIAWALALAGLVLWGAPAGLRSARADEENVYYNPATGHWYKYVAGSWNWATANADADSRGAYLASLTDSAENQWVISVVGTGGNSVWLGGTDEVQENNWKWLSGETWSYTNWNTGEPNNSGVENYLMMYNNGKWNDVYPTYVLPGYIAEWNIDPNKPPDPEPPAAPTNLTASLGFYGTISLQWADNSTNEAKFEIERRSGGGEFALLTNIVANGTLFEDENVQPLVQYTYRVRAVNSVGPSDYTNEASATSGPNVPSPAPPSDLIAVTVTETSVDLSWTDNSNGEVGFEVHRRVGNGSYQYRGSRAADVTTFHDAGLTPDTAYGYEVRAVGTLRTSPFAEVGTATLPTLSVVTLKGDLKDTTKFGKDLVKATASYEPLAGALGEGFDPLADGLTLRMGTEAAPVVLKALPFDEGWKGKGTIWKWKSAKGAVVKAQIKVDLAKREVSAIAKGLELQAPAENPMRVSVVLGVDAGTDWREWPASKKAGVYKLR